MGRMALVFMVLAATGLAIAGLVPGGGKAASDCYVEFDVGGASGSNKVTCVDGDPACDADGQCQGVCTFSVAVCVNQPNVASCTPATPKKPVKVRGASIAVPATSDASPACGELSQVPVALKGKKRTKPGRKVVAATAVVDGKPARDADRLVLRCMPREGACPTTTTTTTTTTVIATTSTTTTTIASTTTLPPDAHLLLTGSRLATFSTLDPSVVGTPIALTGMTAGETLVSIDRRPRNGMLYGLGFDAAAGTVQLYVLHPATAFVTPIGPTGTFVGADGPTPVSIGEGSATRFGMDFNPAVDRVRVVNSAGQNFRMNPNSGAFVDGDLGGSAGSVAGLNMDGPIDGATDTVQETAYTNVDTLATVTTQYTLDASLDSLCIQNPPNGGTQTACKALGTAIDAVLGFDVPPGVNAPANNTVASGQGIAVVRPAGQASDVLAPVDLTTGTLGTMTPLGTTDTLGIAVQKPASVPIVGLDGAGTSLVRFTSSAPGTTVTVPLTGVAIGETMVGIDFRPQTGQLFGFAVNAAADSGTLYRIDPQTGASTTIGAPGQIAFVIPDGVTPIDFPDPAAGWGVDFNPAVDRLRVDSGTGLNFRVNPNNGAPVDGNLGQAMAVPGTNPDSSINGGTTGVHAVAYTNAVGRDLSVAGPTTQYTLDATTDSLFVQNPPNSGTQTNPAAITLGGSLLDFTAQCGFDIPSDVRVTASGTAATSGSGYAALTVGGTTLLCTIDLTNGVATIIGSIGSGSTSLTGLTIGQTALE